MRSERLAWLVVSAVGALVVWYATANGVGITLDSMTYIRGAENIARGHGYSLGSESSGFAGITHWPPLYSMTIAPPIRAGLSATAAVRIVNAASFFALLYLSALLVRRLSPGSRATPIVAAICVGVAWDVLQNFVMVWSEALFLPLVLLAFLKMLDYTERGRLRDLLAAGVCFGLSVVCRYSGAGFIAGAIAWLAVAEQPLEPARTRSRLAHVLAFGAVSGLATVVLLLRNVLVASDAHGRTFDPHLISIEHVRVGAESLTRWLLPTRVPLELRVAWLVVFALLIYTVLRRNRNAARIISDDLSRHRRFWVLMGMCVAAYLTFTLVTILFFDFAVRYDMRMMSPVLVLAIVCFAVVGPGLFARPMAWPAQLAAIALVAAVAQLAVTSAVHVRAAHAEPAEFAAPRWTHAPTWDTVEAIPASERVYSTLPHVGGYFVERAFELLPSAPATDEVSLRETYYGRLREIARGGPSYVLRFPTVGGTGPPLDREAREILHARVVDSTEVMVLYRVGE